METLDILDKKRFGEKLSEEEIRFFFTNHELTDYQLSAMLMAITINGLTVIETIYLTKVLVESGKVIDLSDMEGISFDKHSSGGVGDKVTLILMPLLASIGLKSCKMSGRGLGLTGGTADKLGSIPGIKLDYSIEEMKNQYREIGLVLASQSDELVPLDKKLYEIRDVTATVSSIPLIASSIMSKKIASGAEHIFIDLKVGKGSLIKNYDDAKYLAELMKEIGYYFNKNVYVELSNMDQPLGRCVGNKLEVLESILILEGKTSSNLTRLISKMAIDILTKIYMVDKVSAAELLKTAIASGRALEKFEEVIEYQGGNLDKLKIDASVIELKSIRSGKLEKIDAEKIALLVKKLGAGRDRAEDEIDTNVGIAFSKLAGEEVKSGELLAKIYYNKEYPDLQLAFDSFVIK